VHRDCRRAPFEAGGSLRGRDRPRARRGWDKTIGGQRPRCRCAIAPAPKHASTPLSAEHSACIALPASIRRSVRLPCACASPYPTTTDGIRLYIPLAGLNKLELAAWRCSHPCGAYWPRGRFLRAFRATLFCRSRAVAACGRSYGPGPGHCGSFLRCRRVALNKVRHFSWNRGAGGRLSVARGLVESRSGRTSA
jgi:hypothetical protein